MTKTLLITLLLSTSAFSQTRPDMSSNPSQGFGTLPQDDQSTIQENRGNTFPKQEMEEKNNFAGGALGGAEPGAPSPGVAPTSPNLPKSGVGTETTMPSSAVPMTP